VSVPDDLARTYRVGFLRYLDHGQEAALASGYELGRSALAEGISVLEIAQLHHDLLLEVLQDGTEDLTQASTAASEFFLEVLATYDMAQRGFLNRR
jgi:Phosphoserine phosphatase RsbU, N-terminal domain